MSSARACFICPIAQKIYEDRHHPQMWVELQNTVANKRPVKVTILDASRGTLFDFAHASCIARWMTSEKTYSKPRKTIKITHVYTYRVEEFLLFRKLKKKEKLTESELGQAFLSASLANNVEMMRMCVERGSVPAHYYNDARLFAVETGNNQIFNYLSSVQSRDEEKESGIVIYNNDEPFLAAVKNGSFSMTQNLLQDGVSDEVMKQAFFLAVEKNFADIVHLLSPRFSHLSLSKAAMTAMTNKNFALFDSLSMKGMCPDHYGPILLLGAENGHYGAVKSLLDKNLAQGFYNHAFLLAFERCHIHIMLELLQTQRVTLVNCSKQTIDICNALKAQDYSQAITILNQGQLPPNKNPFTLSDCQLILIKAASLRQPKVLRALSKHNTITQEDWAKAFNIYQEVMFIEKKESDSLEKEFRNSTRNPEKQFYDIDEKRGAQVIEAVKKGDAKTFQCLLKEGGIPDEAREKSLLLSIEKEHIGMTEWLMDVPLINKNHDEAFKLAHKLMSFPLLSDLLQRGTFSDSLKTQFASLFKIHDRGVKCLSLLLRNNDDLEKLLATGPIYSIHSRFLILHTILRSKPAILKVIARHNPIPSDKRSEWVAHACSINAFEIAHLLLNLGGISEESQLTSLEYAERAGQTQLVDLLKKQRPVERLLSLEGLKPVIEESLPERSDSWSSVFEDSDDEAPPPTQSSSSILNAASSVFSTVSSFFGKKN